MPLKEWTAEVAGHKIRVENTWTGGTRLYIDGECRDRNGSWFALSRKRWLSAPLKRDLPDSPLVEVFVKALFDVEAQITVAGRLVAGDAASQQAFDPAESPRPGQSEGAVEPVLHGAQH